MDEKTKLSNRSPEYVEGYVRGIVVIARSLPADTLELVRQRAGTTIGLELQEESSKARQEGLKDALMELQQGQVPWRSLFHEVK